MVSIGDTVERIKGSYIGMQVGDTSKVTGVFLPSATATHIHVKLKEYPSRHSMGNLKVIKSSENAGKGWGKDE